MAEANVHLTSPIPAAASVTGLIMINDDDDGDDDCDDDSGDNGYIYTAVT